MQVVGQSWLVVQLTGSGGLLGLGAAAQFLPVLLRGPYGGRAGGRPHEEAELCSARSRPESRCWAQRSASPCWPGFRLAFGQRVSDLAELTAGYGFIVAGECRLPRVCRLSGRHAELRGDR
jgi:hypothetical protein